MDTFGAGALTCGLVFILIGLESMIVGRLSAKRANYKCENCKNWQCEYVVCQNRKRKLDERKKI